jgi:hypothetical protein
MLLKEWCNRYNPQNHQNPPDPSNRYGRRNRNPDGLNNRYNRGASGFLTLYI